MNTSAPFSCHQSFCQHLLGFLFGSGAVSESEKILSRPDKKRVTPKPNPRFDPAQFDPSQIGVQVGGLRIGGKKRAPTKKPNAKAIQGWRAGNTATLAVGNGTLILRSTGNDPQLILVSNPGLSNGPFTVSIRLETTKAGKLLVFCNPPFKRGGFTDFGKVAAGRWVELSGRFATENLTGLRFDPLTTAGQAEIDWIRVVDRNDKLVKEWTFQSKSKR